MSQHDYSFTRAVGALPVQNPNAPKKSKKELEEIRKREEEVAAATAYEEFVASFDEPAKLGKTFVRGTTFNAGTREEKNSQETGKLYRPTSKIAEAVLTRRAHSPTGDDDRERNDKGRKKEKDKKKSNLELFKEELKIIQEEREERHRLKTNLKETVPKPEVTKAPEDPFATIAGISRNQGLMLDDIKIPQFNLDDQTTTNIYLGNVNPKMSEQQLCEIFGRYGPLASIKIMWPRSDEEKARGRNCGFVAFMNRKDGERAMKALNGREIMQYEMKLGWGKAVPIPAQPIYIPPLLLERTLPPPPSGLPFNGQPSKRDRHKIPAGGEQYVLTEENEDEFRQILISAVVKVVVPTERNLLSLIHRMIEFVVREGPMFEAMIMNREINNPVFRFLFENQSPAHVYYRWKLYSILHGDSPSRWRTTDFRMFKNGSIWRPPPINPYTQGMPEELVEKEDLDIIRKGQLSNAQRERFEDMLRTITLERQKIADIMIYCIEHAEAAEEVCDCVTESLSNHDTSLPKKVARLYLVSDILHNCSAKITNVSYYRKGFQEKLPQIFKHFHEACKEIEARLKAEQFKQKVMGCFRSWEEWAIYPSDFLIKLQNIFLGLVPSNQDQTDKPIKEASVDHMGFSYDGAPLEDDDGIDREGPIAETPPRINDDELDGVPINDDDLDGVPLDDLRNSKPAEPKVKFAQSKWETVDPSVIEAQAMTTSKWDLLDQDIPEKEDHYDNNARETDDGDLDGQPMDDESQGDNGEVESERGREARENLEFFKMGKSEERRNKLREIELKVMKCQDELESGKRSRKSGMTISQQVAYYRHKLMKKERLKLELKDSEREKQARRERRDSSSPELKERSKDRDRYRGRSRSSSRSPVHKKIRSAASKRHRSRSPEYRLRASSPSPPRSSSKSHKTKKSRH